MTEESTMLTARDKIWLTIIGCIFICYLLWESIQPNYFGMELYFDDLYRISGKNYYLNYINESKRNELWEWESANETLVHKFPRNLDSAVKYNDKKKSFYYVRRGILYQWNFVTDKESKLFPVEETTLVDILDDYVIFRDTANSFVFYEMESGDVFDMLRVEADHVEIMDIQNNSLLIYCSLGGVGDRVSLYDVDTMTESIVLGGEKGTIIIEGTVNQGLIFNKYVLCYKNSNELYRIDLKTNAVDVIHIPAENEILVALEKSNDYAVCVSRRKTPELIEGQVCLSYYRITLDGVVSKIREWEPVNSVMGNDCILVCDGKYVISGSKLQKEKLEFMIE